MYVEQRLCSHQPALFKVEPTFMYRTVIEAYPVIGVCKTEAVPCMLYLDCSRLQGRECNLYFPGYLESRDHLLALVFIWQRLWSVPRLSI
jgi:hypothetical protein